MDPWGQWWQLYQRYVPIKASCVQRNPDPFVFCRQLELIYFSFEVFNYRLNRAFVAPWCLEACSSIFLLFLF